LLEQLRGLRGATKIQLDSKKEPAVKVQKWLDELIAENDDLKDQFSIQRVRGGFLIEEKVE
jgi:chorismate mutase